MATLVLGGLVGSCTRLRPTRSLSSPESNHRKGQAQYIVGPRQIEADGLARYSALAVIAKG